MVQWTLNSLRYHMKSSDSLPHPIRHIVTSSSQRIAHCFQLRQCYLRRCKCRTTCHSKHTVCLTTSCSPTPTPHRTRHRPVASPLHYVCPDIAHNLRPAVINCRKPAVARAPINTTVNRSLPARLLSSAVTGVSATSIVVGCSFVKDNRQDE